MISTKFQLNSAVGLGGAIASTNAGSILIQRTSFTENSGENGGALALTPSSKMPTVTISESSLANGRAAIHGAGIYATAAKLTISNTNITEGSSGKEGGGIYLQGILPACNTTTAGTAAGAACVFPFVYKGSHLNHPVPV